MTEQQPGTELAYAAAMPAPQGGALPTGLEWGALERMANTLADSDVIPYRLKRKPADVAVILLAAREYGIPPLMALSKLPVVNGTPAPMGELMVALVLRAGHRISAAFRNPDGTVYAGGPLTRQHYGEAIYSRRDWTEPESLRFTLAEAVQAGLVSLTAEGLPRARDSKDQPTPWEQYTPNMARWRAVANACRLAFADVLMGLSYLPEELGAIVDAEGAPVVGEVVTEAPRRRTASGGTVEQRTAQEAADRLADFNGPAAVLDNVLAHATANGYADTDVTYAGERITLEAAIHRRREQLDDVVDGHVVEDKPSEAPAAAQGTPSGPPAAEETPAEAPAPEPGPAAAQEAPAMPDADLALELARAVLEEGTDQGLRDVWRMGKARDVLNVDVVAVVGDDDLAAINMANTVQLPLGALLMAAVSYVQKHGAAIRDLGIGEDTPVASDGPDPWADDPQ